MVAITAIHGRKSSRDSLQINRTSVKCDSPWRSRPFQTLAKSDRFSGTVRKFVELISLSGRHRPKMGLSCIGVQTHPLRERRRLEQRKNRSVEGLGASARLMNVNLLFLGRGHAPIWGVFRFVWSPASELAN